MTREAAAIISERAVRGKLSHDSSSSPNTPAHFSEANPVHETDEAAVAVCFTTRTLCEWLGISIRSWTRAAALGLTPAPDLVVGRSPRWSPQTIERWLKTRPKLPGRGGHHAR